MTIQSITNESTDVVVQRASHILADLEENLPTWSELYRDLHRHPELSFQEHRTAGIVAQHLRDAGYEVTEGVGHTGVVGILHNGTGPVVMLRGDMDALPVKEQTGLDYASEADGNAIDGSTVSVMHACGHDIHTVSLIATAELLSKGREVWRGTVFICAQPAEETGRGAEAMLRDGLFIRFPRPDVCFGQHVLPLASGTVGHNSGVIMSASINVSIRLFGKGGHGSSPQVSVDPVVMASSLVMKLQTIRSREIAGDVPAVITVGFVNAGLKHNVIPDEANIGLNIRTQSAHVQQQILDAIRRMADAEAQAFRAPKRPEIIISDAYPLTRNSEPIDHCVRAIHRALLGSEHILDLPTMMFSEDFSEYGLPGPYHYDGEPVPYCYWLFGGHSKERYDAAPGGTFMAKLPYLPSNHQSNFAPDPEPTLRGGVCALTSAALAYLPAASATQKSL